MKKIAESRRVRTPFSPLPETGLQVLGGSPTLPLPPPRLELVAGPDPLPWRPVAIIPAIGF